MFFFLDRVAAGCIYRSMQQCSSPESILPMGQKDINMNNDENYIFKILHISNLHVDV